MNTEALKVETSKMDLPLCSICGKHAHFQWEVGNQVSFYCEEHEHRLSRQTSKVVDARPAAIRESAG